MRNQLIPPPELAPPSISHLPAAAKIELWFQLLDESEALVRAGPRARIGPDGDLEAAYREWYARHMEEHDRSILSLLKNLSRRERSVAPERRGDPVTCEHYLEAVSGGGGFVAL